MQKEEIRRAYLELHLAVGLFGFTSILGRLISLSSPVLVWHRLWMASLFMMIYLWFFGKLKWPSFRESLRFILFSSTITIHWLLFYGSIKFSGISVTMICLSAVTFFTAILEPIWIRVPFSRIQLFFGILIIAGVWFISGSQKGGGAGILIGLLSAFFSALYTVLNKTIVHKYDSRIQTLYSLAGGLIFLTLTMPLIHYFMPLERVMPTGEDWIYLLVLSFVCTFFAFNLFLRALRHLSSFTANLTNNLELIYGIALAFVFYKEYEMLGAGFYVGSLLIIASVVGEIFYTNHVNKKSRTRL